MNRDVTTLARALLGGDLMVVMQLIDALREQGDDWRANELHREVGTLLASTMPQMHRHFQMKAVRLFWTEAEGRDAMLKAAAESHARYLKERVEADGSPGPMGGLHVPSAEDVAHGASYTITSTSWHTPRTVYAMRDLETFGVNVNGLATGSVTPLGVVESINNEARTVTIVGGEVQIP